MERMEDLESTTHDLNDIELTDWSIDDREYGDDVRHYESRNRGASCFIPRSYPDEVCSHW
jgi:hypothetical protein